MLNKLFLSIACSVAAAMPAMAQEAAPEACYLVGSYNNWTTPDATDLSTLHTLTDEDADGIYYGKFKLAAGEFDFKVFTAVTNWMDGIQYFGTNKEVSWATINTEKYQTVFEGGHNFTCPQWDGGELEMYYDYENNQFWFEVERPCIYMTIPDLSVSSDIMAMPVLFETETPGIYETAIKFSANEKISFFFMEDLDYTKVFAPEGNIDVAFEENDDNAVFNGTFSTSSINQNNRWIIRDFPGGDVNFVVNTETNTITVSYKIIKQKECIYLVGQPSGWTEPAEYNASYYLNYQLILNNNGEYEGVFDINAGEMMFRFYTELSGWDGGASVGSQEADNPIDVEMTDGVYTGSVVKGKGSWNFPAWTGGKAEIRVNMTDMTIYVAEYTETPPVESFLEISTPVVSDITDHGAKISFTATMSENFIGENITVYINDEEIGSFPIEQTSMDLEHTFADGLEPGVQYNIPVYVAIGEMKSNVEYAVFNTTSGIEGIDAENATAEYFNLQGICVENPKNGLFIRLQGNKVEKVIVR